MTHQIVLDIPDEVFVPLARRSQEAGKPVETFAAECLAEAVRPRGPSERLRRLAGAFASGVPDAAERVDDYLGQAFANELRGGRDG